MLRTKNPKFRLPEHLRKNRGSAGVKRNVSTLLRQKGLHTVCEEARCPNIGECFARGTATFMILGDTCTRRCAFCAVKTGRPLAVNEQEAQELVDAVGELDLAHVVLTSVDRDDLRTDERGRFGAQHFARCIRALKAGHKGLTVEILAPDFQGDEHALDVVLAAQPDVFNHNIETVARLYKNVRPQSSWETTKKVLRYVAEQGHSAVKSGLMVGLGESDDEVKETLSMLKELGVHIATIGQYMRPSKHHWEVARYVEQAAYDEFRAFGEELGLTYVFSGAFVRSSYNAGEALRKHKEASRSSQEVLRVLR
ncbi:MAG: lipoyl synthase [Deltaproteobacteria bacterium]|nr:lipoyl synthase [Deltaproteobacteria bacterium]